MKRSGGAIAPAVLAKKKTPARIDIIGEPETDELRAFGGSRSDKFNGVLINDGVDVRLVQEFLGHASITSTAIYTAISPKRLAGVRVR